MAGFSTDLLAVRPSAELLPENTKGHLSIPDVDLLIDRWVATQLGQLVRDPQMGAFVDDLKRQIRTKLSKTNTRLGIGIADLEDVYGGEVSVAVVQPWDAEEAEVNVAVEKSVAAARNAGKSEKQIAEIRKVAERNARADTDRRRREEKSMVLLADVTGHEPEAHELLEKVAADLRARGGTEASVNLSGVETVQFVMPPNQNRDQRHEIYYVIHQQQLVMVDHRGVATGILRRFDGTHHDSLEQSDAFRTVRQRTLVAFNELTPHVHWYVEPFGYVEVIRAYEGGRRRRGTDLLKVLQNQGFDAIRSLGGAIALASDDFEIVHHSFISAPPIPRQEGRPAKERYHLAANMLKFPNKKESGPMFWIPGGLSTFLTFNWDMKNAFEYARTLVDEIAGDEVFEDVLKSIETDPNGPQINIRQGLINHLSDRATVISDYREPIGPKSERLLFAIEVANPDAVMKTVNKAMKSDPAAKRREHNGHVIWEILNEDLIEVPAVQIDNFGGFGFDEVEPVEELEKPTIPNSAVTVAYGHLLVASHVDYIVEILERPAGGDQLSMASDYAAVSRALVRLGSNQDALRFFSRTAEAYRPTYELVRQGRMPESETVLGKLLNRLWEPDEKGALREQHIDGAKMPEFSTVQKYLGPAGFYVRSHANGWAIAGCLLERAE